MLPRVAEIPLRTPVYSACRSLGLTQPERRTLHLDSPSFTHLMSGRPESITVARLTASSSSVKQVPEPVSPRYRSRVLKVESRYRSQFLSILSTLYHTLCHLGGDAQSGQVDQFTRALFWMTSSIRCVISGVTSFMYMLHRV
jgi:hypothetical protein